eukprot:CAMPEP_0194499726 /NCGR_PEP_ID=MMETSP0253-20130528/15941_1 /TAXON_ID=2966 /ORGANISM="Noctiluca scintillans" /LENGTH=218 /DNA_ID=CAMNT_0039341501 /DNA_START=128 /DNA_END=784 /DNA_ORIENTATION=+
MSEGYAQESFDAQQGGADGADYLSFEKGDALFRIRDETGGWSWGRSRGQSGWYPTAFWTRADAPPVRETLVGEALGAFDGTGYGEQYLSFSRGQVLQLLYVCRQPNSGWALGAIVVDGQPRHEGWFPAAFVKVDGLGHALSNFDGNEYGPTYLSFQESDVVQWLHRCEDDPVWSFGELLSRDECAPRQAALASVQGYYPTEYVQLDHPRRELGSVMDI